MLNVILLCFSLSILLTTRCYLVLPNKKSIKNKRKTSCKTCIVLGSGGHTAEMMQLITGLKANNYNPRTYVLASTDALSEKKAIEYEKTLNQGSYRILKISRAREVGQAWSSVPMSVLVALISSIKVIIQSWPDLILCNGPGSCIPICILAYIPRILGIKKIEIIYVESFARVESLSLTGKLLYHFADRFLVQWPQLSEKFQKAEYKGILV